MTSQVHKPAILPPYPRRPVVRTVKFFVSIGFYGITQLWRILARALGVKPLGTTIGIFYHQVLPSEVPRFRQQMDLLLRVAVPVSAHELPPLKPGMNAIFVTADDAWKSFVDNAIPELIKRQIPCTIFAIADRLGDSLGEVDDRIVSESELVQLPSDLITVGSHTLTHPNLTTLSSVRALAELSESRQRLENILGTDVSLFCPPFGASDDRILELCHQAGYEHVYMSTLASSRDNFALGRIRADPSDWTLEFHLKLLGAYNWVPWSIRLKAHLISLLSLLRRRSRQRPVPLQESVDDSRPTGGMPDHSMTKLG